MIGRGGVLGTAGPVALAATAATARADTPNDVTPDGLRRAGRHRRSGDDPVGAWHVHVRGASTPILGAQLTIEPITEPDLDRDLRGDVTEDRTDLKLSTTTSERGAQTAKATIRLR